MKKILFLFLFLFTPPVFAQTPIACAPVPVGQSVCKLSWDVAIDPNIQQFVLVSDTGTSLSLGIPATKTTNIATGMDTYTAVLPLTIVPVENVGHTVRLQSCRGTTAANATSCTALSAPLPAPGFTSGLATVTGAPRLSTSP